MAYTINALAPSMGGLPPIASFDTLDSRYLGYRVVGFDPDRGYGEFIYLKGVASTAIGSWVTIFPDDWTTALLVANAIGDVGIAMSANIVATTGGWYQIYGKASGLALTAFADNGRCYATATAGSIDDAVVDGDLVHKALGASAVNETTLLADFEIHYPYNDDINSND
jgi:hypothetical protein